MKKEFDVIILAIRNQMIAVAKEEPIEDQYGILTDLLAAMNAIKSAKTRVAAKSIY